MESRDINDKYGQLIKDINFDKLDLELKNPNIFHILKISNTEIRHSNFLSWLLNPSESHKMGDIFLKRFLREVFSSEKFDELNQIDVEGMNLSSVQVNREWKNIDILIVMSEIVVCIENKILSKEHSNQLKRYKEIIQKNYPNHKHTFVYLTPFGELSENETETYESISYQFIIETLERILSVYGNSLNNLVKIYIKDYIIMVKRDLMKTDESIELSKKIYQNHRELLDFIFENKPDLVDDLRKLIKEEIIKRNWTEGSENKYYVRFLTDKIKNLIYYNNFPQGIKNGWNKKESFLFEIVLYPSSNYMTFKTVISPSDTNYDVKKLEKFLLEIDGFIPSKGQKWLVNFSMKSKKFNYEEINSLSDQEIREFINVFFDEIKEIISKVEEKFIEHKTELLNMKNNDVGNVNNELNP